MITINISEETETYSEMAEALRRIADLLEQGYTSGTYPNWDTPNSGDEEKFYDEADIIYDWEPHIH